MGSDTIPHRPAHIPYHSLECLLSISLRVPSQAGGVCRVLPLCRASRHMPVVGAQRVSDFPPAWGEVGVCLQALVTPEVVCAEGECEAGEVGGWTMDTRTDSQLQGAP